jgi:hypothetical protein
MGLIQCPDCQKMISDKAPACINCGRPMISVQAQDKSSIIQGENLPPEDMIKAIQSTDTTVEPEDTKTSRSETKKMESQKLSWLESKLITFTLAIVITIPLFLGLSALTGAKPTGNIIWTVFWIYLSIRLWRYWRWKAFLPYPIFVIVSGIIGVVLIQTGNDQESTKYMAAKGLLNLGGLGTLYLALKVRKDQEAAISVQTGQPHRNKIEDNVPQTSGELKENIPETKEWYYRDSQYNSHGPFSLKEMKDAYSSGIINEFSPVKSEIMSGYLSLRNMDIMKYLTN